MTSNINGGEMKRSEVIREIGMEILELITESINNFDTEQGVIKFNEEQIKTRKEAGQEILHVVLDKFNAYYTQALKEEEYAKEDFK